MKIDHRPGVAAQRRIKMRGALLRAGLEVMARKGIAATSIDDVVKQAGVARGSFYKYFESTAELATAVGVSIAEETILALEDDLLKIGDPAERLASGLDAVLAMVTAYPIAGRFIVRAGWPSDATDGLVLDKIGGAIVEGIEQRRFLPVPMPVAMSLVGGIAIGCINEIGEGRGSQAIRASAVETVLLGLGLTRADAAAIADRPIKAVRWEKGQLLQGLTRTA